MNKKDLPLIKNVFVKWLPLAITIFALSVIIYLVAQQNYRINANDPQIQIAQDVTNQINKGQSPQYFIPQGKSDITKSLSAFIMLFDENGKLIGSSATINGKVPVLPEGVLKTTAQKGETRFTWQPQKGIRTAVVVDYYKSTNYAGFVLVGRPLKEVEARIDNLGLIILFGLVITLATSFLTTLFLQKIR